MLAATGQKKEGWLAGERPDWSSKSSNWSINHLLRLHEQNVEWKARRAHNLIDVCSLQVFMNIWYTKKSTLVCDTLRARTRASVRVCVQSIDISWVIIQLNYLDWTNVRDVRCSAVNSMKTPKIICSTWMCSYSSSNRNARRVETFSIVSSLQN